MRFFKSEAGAVVLWVVASIGLAALISPWLFDLGKDFAAQHAESGGLFGRLAGSCERAKFSRYFNRSLMLSALVLFWPLWLRVRMIGRNRAGVPSPASEGLGWRPGLIQCVAGFALAASLLWLLGTAVVAVGAFVPIEKPVSAAKLLNQALFPAIGASIVEEWLFRALLMGLWLRISRPIMACIGTSIVFAFLHFLEPPHGVEIADPRAWSSGFELLGWIMRSYLNPQFIAAEFLTLFVVGMTLGWARLRTGSLWLPIGMHAGWIFAFKSFNMHHVIGDTNVLGSLLVGGTLRAGLLPLATLTITWVLIALAIRRLPGGASHAESRP
ncbi:MAG: lysostaphin resistance A-like protein [Luteolibacter sp.]|jgi:uncharacterized protein